MGPEILGLDNTEKYQLQAWRICRAWKQTLGVRLDVDRVAKHLCDMEKYFSVPTPLVDKILAEVEAARKSKIVVLAEIKEPGGNRARKGDAHETDSASALEKSVFED
jgi:hypothetical protein